MLRVITVFYIFALIIITARRIPFFRKDYAYVKLFNAFYKLYPASQNGSEWRRAFDICEDEGAHMFYPRTIQEIAVVKELSGNRTDAEYLIGFHDPFDTGVFITVDGGITPLPILKKDDHHDTERRCITMNVETLSFNSDYCDTPMARPFVCRKIDDLDPCPTVDKGYVHDRSMDKCYKFHSRPKKWHDAWKTCYMEGAKLLVIDDEQEMRIITNRIAAREQQLYYIGFHRVTANGDLYTVNASTVNRERKPTTTTTTPPETKLKIRSKFLAPIFMKNEITSTTTKKPIKTYVPDLLTLRIEQVERAAIEENLSADKNFSWYLPSNLRSRLMAKVGQLPAGSNKQNNETRVTQYPTMQKTDFNFQFFRPTILSNLNEMKNQYNEEKRGGYKCYACRNLIKSKNTSSYVMPTGNVNLSSDNQDNSDNSTAPKRSVRLESDGYNVWRNKKNDTREDCGIIDVAYFKTQNCGILSPFICEMESAKK